MRSEADVIRVEIELFGTFELDFQRMVEDDPNWLQICSQCDMSDPRGWGLRNAINLYIKHYILRERFLRDMPTTNGPGELTMGKVYIDLHEEIPFQPSKEIQNDSSSGSSLGSEDQGDRSTELSAEDPR